MALFTLSDITYKEQAARTIGPLPNEKFGTNLLRYPIDIGSVDKGHYMVIHIQVQDKTEYSYEFASDTRSQIQKNRQGLFGQTNSTNLGGTLNSVVGAAKKLGQTGSEFLKDNFTGQLADTAKNIVETGTQTATKFFQTTLGAVVKPSDVVGIVTGAAQGAGEAFGSLNNVNFLRRTKRTTDSIALYMPNTLNFTHTQGYSDLELGSETAALLGAVGKVGLEGGVDPTQKGRNLSPFLLQKIASGLLANKLIDSPKAATAAFIGATGLTQNPQLELIYTTPSFRDFRFSFMFYPRSEQEAEEVQKLIRRLKFHQAPEVKSGSAGYFLVPPSEFDIEFYYNGQINPNIPTISTCVLTSIDMDYAPNGFHTFETPGDNSPQLGKTGMPTAIRMDLSFKETEIMTKFNFQDFSPGDRTYGGATQAENDALLKALYPPNNPN
jgi:hypothetical protein